MFPCNPLGGVPVIFAAMTPSEMRLFNWDAPAVDQLSPAAEAPALVSTKMVRPVELCRYE